MNYYDRSISSMTGSLGCTIMDDCARIAESGLKEPFESPHLVGVVLPHLPVGRKSSAFLSCVTWIRLTKTD